MTTNTVTTNSETNLGTLSPKKAAKFLFENCTRNDLRLFASNMSIPRGRDKGELSTNLGRSSQRSQIQVKTQMTISM